MKRFNAIAIVFSLSLAFVFGSGQAENEAKKEESKQLRIMWWGSQTRHERTVEVINMYSEKTGVDVDYEFSGWTDHWTKLTTMAAGGNLPDIMQIDISLLNEWVSRGLLLPVDAYAESGTLDLSDVSKSALAGGNLNGQQFAIPLGINSEAMSVDVDLFNKAGIPIPSDDWTWQEFEEIALKLHDKLGIWGFGASLDKSDIWTGILGSNGMERFDLKNGGLGYTDDSVHLEHMNRVLRLQEAGAIPPISVEISDYERGINIENLPGVKGKSAMSYFWSNQLNAFWTAAGGPEKHTFQLVMVPRSGDLPGNFVKPAMFFAVTRDSKNPELAADFISYFTNDVEVHKVLKADRGVPVSAHVQEAMKDILTPSEQVVFDYMVRVSEKGGPLPATNPAGWSDLLNNVYEPVVREGIRFGEYTPVEALKIFHEEAKNIIKPTM